MRTCLLSSRIKLDLQSSGFDVLDGAGVIRGVSHESAIVFSWRLKRCRTLGRLCSDRYFDIDMCIMSSSKATNTDERAKHGYLRSKEQGLC
jgi:hypothetical protein